MKTLHEYIYYRMTKWHASYFGYKFVSEIGVVFVSTLYFFTELSTLGLYN